MKEDGKEIGTVNELPRDRSFPMENSFYFSLTTHESLGILFLIGISQQRIGKKKDSKGDDRRIRTADSNHETLGTEDKSRQKTSSIKKELVYDEDFLCHKTLSSSLCLCTSFFCFLFYFCFLLKMVSQRYFY